MSTTSSSASVPSDPLDVTQASAYDHDPLTARRTLLISGLATLATFLDTTVLYVAFPDIGATFAAADVSTLSWVLNAYTIVFAALLVPAGKLADRLGHRRAFLVGSFVFTLASMGCGLAPSVGLLIASRAVQAIGAAVLIPSSLALVIHAFPREKVPWAVAIWGAAGAVAGALGPTLGAAIVESLGWRWAFYINLPIGMFTIISGRSVLRESANRSVQLPKLLGIALVAAATALLSYAVVESEAVGWMSAQTIGVFAVGLALLVLFIGHQRRTDAPALDLELFRIGNFAWGNLSAFAFGLAFSAMFLGSILFLTNVWQWSVLKAGFGIAPGPAFVAVLAPLAGKLAGTIGQRPLLLVGGAFYALGGLYRIVWLGPNVNYWFDYFPSMLLTGAGVALCLPQLSSVVAQALPPNRIGVGGAVQQSIRQFGGTFGVALTIAFLGAAGTPGQLLNGFERIWWVIVAGGAATTVFAVPLVTRPSATTTPLSEVGE